ncbi:MAG: hypothetical protein WCK42_05915 [Myxococcaceae bacterium]
MIDNGSFNNRNYDRPDKILMGSNPGHSERIRKESELNLGMALLVGEDKGLAHAISRHVSDYHNPEKEYIFGDNTVAKVLHNFLEKFKPDYKAKLLVHALDSADPEVTKIARKIAKPVEVVSDEEGFSSDDSSSIET